MGCSDHFGPEVEFSGWNTEFAAWANSCEKHLSKPTSKLSERPPLGLRFLDS